MAFFRNSMQRNPVLDEETLRALGVNRGQPLDNPNPQVLTPANQQAITRPRIATPAATSMRDMIAQQSQQPVAQPSDVSQNPVPPRQMQSEMNPLPTKPFSIGGQNVAGEASPFGSNEEPFAADRPRRTQMRDFISDDSAYLRDLENQPRNWKDKTVDAIRALGTNFNGQSASPPTKRERAIAQAQGTLGRDLTVDKAQTAAELGSLVPVQLEDGRIVMTPARSAGSLASQQQAVKTRNDSAAAHVARWKQMGRHEAVGDALRVYNSGGANDPETLKAISETLDLPSTLKPKFLAGEIMPQVDENFNVQLINKRDGSVVDTGVTSSQSALEQGRNTRRDKNAVDAMERTKVIAQTGAAKMGDIPELEKTRGMLETYADEKEQEAKDLADSQMKSDKEKAAKLQGEATQYRLHAAGLGEAIAKARGAQGAVGNTTANSGSQYAGRRISRAKIPEFARRHNMTPEAASKFLTDSKAIVY